MRGSDLVVIGFFACCPRSDCVHAVRLALPFNERSQPELSSNVLFLVLLTVSNHEHGTTPLPFSNLEFSCFVPGRPTFLSVYSALMFPMVFRVHFRNETEPCIIHSLTRSVNLSNRTCALYPIPWSLPGDPGTCS